MTHPPLVRPDTDPTSAPLSTVQKAIRSTPLRQSMVFVGLIYAIVIATALALPHAAGEITPLLAMQTPVFVVLLITAFGTARGGRRALWASVGLRRLGLRSWPVAFLVSSVAVLVLPYAVALALGSATLITVGPSAAFWVESAANLLVQVALVTLLALGEEIGWRGYLLPRVQLLVSPRRAAVIVGFVHGCFHLPLILLTTTYDSIGSRWIVAPMVVAALTGAGVFYAWLRDRSGSVWPVALAHGTVNTVIDGAGLVVVVAPVTLAYTAGESGVATLVVILALAAFLLRRAATWRTVVRPAR